MRTSQSRHCIRRVYRFNRVSLPQRATRCRDSSISRGQGSIGSVRIRIQYTCSLAKKRTTMGRPVWKGPFFVKFPGLAEAIKNNTPIKTNARACTILPQHVGAKFLVHNGKSYLPVLVTREMIGHRLGEFSLTKKPAVPPVPKRHQMGQQKGTPSRR